MKKYLLTFLIAIIIGFFLSNFFINQYDDYNGIKVSNNGDNMYFIQYGVFSSKESMEENTISLQNYIYNINDNQYYVYVGITKLEENTKKIVNYFKQLGYETIIKEYQVSDENFINLMNNYDDILLNATDNSLISSVINEVLTKYEEVVINGSKNQGNSKE